MYRFSPKCAITFAIALTLVRPLAGQIPDTFRNLQFLDPDISRDSLLAVMRGFSFALGVRCQYCHVGGDGISFEGVEFDRDDDPDKRKARYMLEMVQTLNDQYLAQLPERDTPSVTVECKTCHRGSARPFLLRQRMRAIIEASGVESAVTFYRTARERVMKRGRFDFGEWETNVLAEQLQRDGRPTDAIAVYLLNAEYYPESASIQLSLGQLYEEVGDTASAVTHYERTLELAPDNRVATERLRVLKP